jgi:hypothetical protein
MRDRRGSSPSLRQCVEALHKPPPCANRRVASPGHEPAGVSA